MRVMLTMRMDIEKANHSIQSGEFSKILETLSEEFKPEATYFFASQGKRTGLMVLDLQDSSQIPLIAEPLFNALGAEIEIQPVMNAEEVRRGLAAVDRRAAPKGQRVAPQETRPLQ